PDGCLYVLDWYDRYHCYQDANRDPNGIDRKNGRLYRIRYKDSPRAPEFDLAKETNRELLERLSSANVYYRETAHRLLVERGFAAGKESREWKDLKTQLGRRVAAIANVSRKERLHALWAWISIGDLLPTEFLALLTNRDPAVRAWGARAAGNQGELDQASHKYFVKLAKDKSPDVLLQVAIAAPKIKGIDPITVLLEVLQNAGDEKLIPAIVWQNLHPMLEDKADVFLKTLKSRNETKNLGLILPRAVERILATKKPDPQALASLYE